MVLVAIGCRIGCNRVARSFLTQPSLTSDHGFDFNHKTANERLLKMLSPGRELDKLVAEKVFGMKVAASFESNAFEPMTPMSRVPLYSTEIAQAMTVREKARIKSIVWIDDGKVMAQYGDGLAEVGISEAHAICLAALKAVDARK